MTVALVPGTALSHATIVGPLGAGAIGEVYRARDTKLGREVAIKVLPDHFADDEERLKRFEREAKTLASLDHPYVAQIHGVDPVDDGAAAAAEAHTTAKRGSVRLTAVAAALSPTAGAGLWSALGLRVRAADVRRASAWRCSAQRCASA